MAQQHRAPLAAFVLVTMVAGGVVVQAQRPHLGEQDRTSATAASSAPQVPTSVPARSSSTPSAAPRTPAAVPTPTVGASDGAESVPGTGRPGDVPPELVGLISAIPGLASFLDGGSFDTPASPSGQPTPGNDQGSGSSPTPGPGTPSSPTPPTPSGDPSGQPSPSPDPSPSGSPSTPPSPDSTQGPTGDASTGEADRPTGPAPTASSTATSAPTP